MRRSVAPMADHGQLQSGSGARGRSGRHRSRGASRIRPFAAPHVLEPDDRRHRNRYRRGGAAIDAARSPGDRGSGGVSRPPGGKSRLSGSLLDQSSMVFPSARIPTAASLSKIGSCTQRWAWRWCSPRDGRPPICPLRSVPSRLSRMARSSTAWRKHPRHQNGAIVG